MEPAGFSAGGGMWILPAVISHLAALHRVKIEMDNMGRDWSAPCKMLHGWEMFRNMCQFFWGGVFWGFFELILVAVE